MAPFIDGNSSWSSASRALKTLALRSKRCSTVEPKWYGALLPPKAMRLSVDDEVTIVGERLVLGESNLLPERVGQRFARDHQGVDGYDGPSLAGQHRREALGGSHHEFGVDRTADRDDLGPMFAPARQDPRHRAVLEDLHAQGFVDIAQTPHETRGVDSCAVWRVRGTERAGHRTVESQRRHVEPLQVLLAQTVSTRFLDASAKPLRLDLIASEGEGSSLDEVGVDMVGSRGGTE